MTQDHPLRSVYTSNLPEIFRQLNISLAVTTYQAGRVILVRYEKAASDAPLKQGGSINTHFRFFDKPMGLCVKDNRLSIGGARTVWEYRNVPAVVDKLDPPGKHDACFVPRSVHFTGNIDIHEMNWSSDDQLWLVNTRFSCLCTLDKDHSFHPRWRPSFVSALSPEDRCHLNGLAMRDGKPRYVTALGETDTRGEWRSNKVSGGILMDIESGEVLLRGLSMPHSPRWYRNKLWVLESGKGSLCLVDLQKRTLKTVATMPGFTRGIDFIGPLAFIGLSKVRETAVFSGLQITKDLTERSCGVWVVNIESGETLGFLRFESDVAEIFAVQVLQGIGFPELLPSDAPMVGETYVLPDEALADVALPTQQQFEGSPHGVFARGVKHFTDQQYEQAVRAFRECLELQPDFPDARHSLGIALAENGQWKEALPELEAARDKEPDRADIQVSLGSLYQRTGDFGKARTAFETAIVRQPDNPVPHMSLATLLLQLGDYQKGFEEYEWRLKAGHVQVPRSPHPAWNGKPVRDKTLLLFIEHNDLRRVFLLARYIPRLAGQCNKLILMCPDMLAPLLAILPGVTEIRKPGEVQVSEFDVQVSMDSLPHLFASTVETIPGDIPYFDIETLRRRSEGGLQLEVSSSRRVGLVWNDSNPEPDKGVAGHFQDCLVQVMQAMLDIEGVDFYRLTHAVTAGASAQVQPNKSSRFRSVEVKDLSEMALALDQLDLVIGADFPAIHLAGALGKPAWVLLGSVYEWYWPAKPSVAVWYPKTRIFHQSMSMACDALIVEVRAALEAWVLESGSAKPG